MKTPFLIAVASLALCAAVPAQAQAPKTPCLMIGQVYDFKPLPGNRSLVVTDRFRKKFKLSFNATCNDLQFNSTLGFKSFGTGQLSCLSRGDYVLSHSYGGPADRCHIDKIEYYTPEMEHADAVEAAAMKHH